MFHVHSVHGYNISKKYPMFYQPNPQLEKSEPKSLWVFFSCSLYSFAWISLVFWELLLGSYYILRWFVCKTHPRQKIDNSFVWFTVFHLHMDVCNHIFFSLLCPLYDLYSLTRFFTKILHLDWTNLFLYIFIFKMEALMLFEYPLISLLYLFSYYF